MTINRLIFALLATLASLSSWACTPSPLFDSSGFIRDQVDHLPKNARGVMFRLASGKLKASDFRVTSDQDKRALTLRLHPVKGLLATRLEPAQGFQAGARYEFTYVSSHGMWRYPDKMSVVIDDLIASTNGSYLIELAQGPAHRVVPVPTTSGSCVEPATAVVQEFTYAIPPSLNSYRNALDYGAEVAPAQRNSASKPLPAFWSWDDLPSLYAAGQTSLALGFSKKYNAQNNAVIAACNRRWPRQKLRGFVSFPELDELIHRTPDTEFDISKSAEEECDDLDALLRTIGQPVSAIALRDACQGQLARSYAISKPDLSAVEAEVWERDLEFLYGMSPTCNLVGLAYLWHNEQFSLESQTLQSLGLALSRGMSKAQPEQREAAVHALGYLVTQLPQSTRSVKAPQFLAPMQLLLVDMLAQPHPSRPSEVTSLIKESGPLSPESRVKLQTIAQGKTAAAPDTRALLN